MRSTNPQTGQTYFEKRRRRYPEAGQPRELTFSCYRRYPFLSRDRTREWFREALQAARCRFGVQLWAYVVMPEHVHLLVVAGEVGIGVARPSNTQGMPPSAHDHESHDDLMSRFLQALKEPVARKAIAYLRETAPAWLGRIRVQEGRRVRHRFWQPGGGYDRNVTDTSTLRLMIEYLHANPVRRGLVARAEDWEWSSARWYAGMRPVKIEMDRKVLAELQWD
jgi:putative transposase